MASSFSTARELLARPGVRLGVLAAGLGLALALGSGLGPWQTLERWGFDALTVTTAPGPGELPLVLVGIDEASFADLGLQWPWPRSLHGQLVDSLSRAGAEVIAFDVVFAEPSEPAEDEAFAAALERAGNVVLAADRWVQETPHGLLAGEVWPPPELAEGAAGVAQVGVELDGDTILRRLPPREGSFWHAVLELYGRRTGRLVPPPPADGALLRYAGPDHTFPYVSYYQALEAETMLPPGTFAGAIVLIGRDVKVSPEPGVSQADLFATPFLARTGLLTPGVEIHANALATAASGRAVRPAGGLLALMVLGVTLGLGALLLRRWHPWRGLGAVVALAAALLLAAAALFVWGNLWLPVLAPTAGLALLYVGQGTFTYLDEARQRRWLKGAFSRYVAPEVVERLLAHPEALRLGGERRELTVLFADLAGFTDLSEVRSPEEVVLLLNRCLTRMAGIIQAHGGTIDKFIGDAVMAFWNAPLDDPEHAGRGCAAARAMQAEMARLREELAAEGLPELALRIGLHSGPAVVGNMGSEERFDYTAVGDTVNLASRLEGINKLYGTGILLSGATAALAGGAVPLRPVDRVRVKGRGEAVDIFTPCQDRRLAEITGEALAAFRHRDWAAAEEGFRGLAAEHPDDPLSAFHLARLAAYRRKPPPAAWDGAVSLDKA